MRMRSQPARTRIAKAEKGISLMGNLRNMRDQDTSRAIHSSYGYVSAPLRKARLPVSPLNIRSYRSAVEGNEQEGSRNPCTLSRQAAPIQGRSGCTCKSTKLKPTKGSGFHQGQQFPEEGRLRRRNHFP